MCSQDHVYHENTVSLEINVVTYVINVNFESHYSQ